MFQSSPIHFGLIKNNGYRMMEAILGFRQGSLFNFIDKLGHLIFWSSTEDEFRDVKNKYECP